MELSGQLHTPALYLRGKSPRYLFSTSLWGPRTGLEAVEKTRNVLIPGINPRL
jgi:hypothetical protein